MKEQKGRIADDFEGMDPDVWENNLNVFKKCIQNNYKIIIVSSFDTIQYFKNLMYTLIDIILKNHSKHHRKRWMNYHIYPINIDELYEKTRSELLKKKMDESEINKVLNNVVIVKIFDKLKNMKFDTIIQNPPYRKTLHLSFFQKGLDCLDENGQMVIIEPATWLIDVFRPNSTYVKGNKSNPTPEIKKRIKGHVKSVVIENLNKEFNTVQYTPFAITTIDMRHNFDTIEFDCCGEHKTVKSLNDCNLIGDYDTVMSILNKVMKYGDFMKNHITKEKIEGDNICYVRYSELYGYLCQFERNSGGCSYDDTPNGFQHHSFGDYFTRYSACSWYYINNEISDTPHCCADNRGGKIISDKIADNVYGTRQELENWHHFIFNNKLSLFLSIVVSIDHNNNNTGILPWLVDHKYTDDEINELFQFTIEEIKFMDDVLKKFERNSPWFRRYICGKPKESKSEE